MRLIDRINVLQEGFYEGCELGDGISSLLSAASTLSGINCDTEARVALALAESLILEFINYSAELSELDNIDENVYTLLDLKKSQVLENFNR
jgi:hypothetical protein